MKTLYDVHELVGDTQSPRTDLKRPNGRGKEERKDDFELRKSTPKIQIRSVTAKLEVSQTGSTTRQTGSVK